MTYWIECEGRNFVRYDTVEVIQTLDTYDSTKIRLKAGGQWYEREEPKGVVATDIILRAGDSPVQIVKE